MCVGYDKGSNHIHVHWISNRFISNRRHIIGYESRKLTMVLLLTPVTMPQLVLWCCTLDCGGLVRSVTAAIVLRSWKWSDVMQTPIRLWTTACKQDTMMVVGSSIMVWGVFIWHGLSHLIRLNTLLTSDRCYSLA